MNIFHYLSLMSDRDGYIQYTIYFLTFTIVGWVDIFTRKECKDPPLFEVCNFK